MDSFSRQNVQTGGVKNGGQRVAELAESAKIIARIVSKGIRSKR